MVALAAVPSDVDAPTLSATVVGPDGDSEPDTVVLNSLSYAYAGHRPVLSDISLRLPRGSRCLLIGANGAGKWHLPGLKSRFNEQHCQHGPHNDLASCHNPLGVDWCLLQSVRNVPSLVQVSAFKVRNFWHDLPPSSCGGFCAGKTTLLQILAGQYMVDKDAVRILNRPAFHDIQLTSSGDLSYLGQQWRQDVAFAGYNVPIQVPVKVLQSHCY